MSELTPSLADQIAETLGETDSIPVQQIRLIVEHFGAEFAQALLVEVQQIEASGGMPTADGKRRRTPGGAYFYLTRQRANADQQRHIFRSLKKPGKSQTQPQDRPQQPPRPALPVFKWEERIPLLNDLLTERGEATNAKLTLIGKPGKIEKRQDLVITTMSYTPKLPASLPKGVPQPPAQETIYTVYVAAKQWNKIADAIANPEDSLIVEGLCAFDPEAQGMALFAQSVTTKLLQRAKGETQKAEPSEPAASKAAPAPTPATGRAAATRTESTGAGRPQPRPPAPQPRQAPPISATVVEGPPPPEVVTQLADLRRSEQDTRQRLDALKALPANEQVGMARTLQELQRIKDEIKALRLKYPRLG